MKEIKTLNPPMDSMTAKKMNPEYARSELEDASAHIHRALQLLANNGFKNSIGMELAISGLATDARAKCEMIEGMLGGHND